MNTYELEGLAQALFEEAGDALFLFDPDTDELLNVNPLAEKLTEFPRDELLRLPATYLFRFSGKGGKDRLRQASSKTGVFHSQEGYFLRTRRDGVWVAVNLTIARLHVKPKTLALITARDVRERHEAEARLKDMEAELRRVLASAPGCLWSATVAVEGHWTYRYLSPVVEKITGRPAGFFLADPQRWQEVVHPDDLPRYRAACARLSAGQWSREEYRVVWPDGLCRWVRDNVQVSREGGPTSPLRLDGVLTDITDAKRTEEALVQERYLLRALMDNLPDSIYFKDATSRFLRVNRALADRCGLPDPALAVGKSDSDFFTEEHARPAFEDERELMRTGQAIVAKEEKETWIDGRERWVSTTKLPLHDPEGRVVGTFGISRDISRRKAAEEERTRLLLREQTARRQLETALTSLRASEARFRRLFESSIIGVMFADVEGHITDANDAFLQTVGYSRADLPLRWDRQLTPTEYRHLDERAVAQLRVSGVVAPYEKEFLRKDGSRVPVLLGATLLEGSSGNCVCFVLDMTERNRMRSMLVQTEKLASIGMLSAEIAHEINNPLAYVANNLVVLERDFRGLLALVDVYEGSREVLARADPALARLAGEAAEQIDLGYIRDSLERILARTRDGVQRITRIIQGLKSMARTDPSQTEEVQVADLIALSLEMVGGRLKRHGIVLEVASEPTPKLRCAGTQISQVLLNLTINALQAVEAAGRGENGWVRVTSRRAGDEVLIEVADNGTGIDPRDRERIFDPFFTRKPVGEGTGLGLSISHGIITAHGGRIEVDSRPGEGTCFRIFLPLQPEARSEEPVAAPRAQG